MNKKEDMEDKEVIREELAGFLANCYDGSFSRLVCDYIHATGMTWEEVEELVEAMKSLRARI